MCDDEPHQSEFRYVLRLEYHAGLQGARGKDGLASSGLQWLQW